MASEASDGPVLSLINKRIRGLRKKLNRIGQMEEAVAQGKPLNKEQEEVLRSKPAVSAQIEELEKLRQPLSQAVAEELSLSLQRHNLSSASSSSDDNNNNINNTNNNNDQKPNPSDDSSESNLEYLIYLLYFGFLFDVKSQSDFTATMLTRTHERGCCLTYDYVTDDATDLLGEGDLDLISNLGSLLTSRPVDSSFSHKNALQRCIDHAKLWLANSDQPIEPNANVTYAGLREKLNKIMASDYFTTTPEMKAPVEVAAAAAAGNYASFQVPIQQTSQVEGSVPQFQHMDVETGDFQGHETGDNEFSSVDELQKDEVEIENAAEFVSVQQEEIKPQAELEHNEIDPQSKAQQYYPRRAFQNQRGGRGGGGGGGRRGYSNGRGGRGGGGRGGGSYQNGRNQFYEQPGNYYQRNYYNNRGRGGRGGGPSYNNHGPADQGGYAPADVGVHS